MQPGQSHVSEGRGDGGSGKLQIRAFHQRAKWAFPTDFEGGPEDWQTAGYPHRTVEVLPSLHFITGSGAQAAKSSTPRAAGSENTSVLCSNRAGSQGRILRLWTPCMPCLWESVTAPQGVVCSLVSFQTM